MAMISVWYPKEIGKGVQIKVVARQKGDLRQLGGYLSDRLNVGHASLLLDQLPRPVYISWWPQAPATRTPSWAFDVAEEGGSANVMVSVDDLDEPAIAAWWNQLVSSRSGSRGGYDLIGYNCSSAVADALSVGGADKLSPKPAVSMWTPARVEGWASALAAAGKSRKNGIFRHEGIRNFADAALRRMASELGARALAD